MDVALSIIIAEIFNRKLYSVNYFKIHNGTVPNQSTIVIEQPWVGTIFPKEKICSRHESCLKELIA